MANAKIDSNNIPTIMGVLNTNGSTPTNVTINPTTHILDIEDNITGSDLGNNSSARDDNMKTTMIVTDTNGNIIPLYVNSSGQLLIDSN